MKTKAMVICAVFSAVLCIFCLITVPVGTVPVSLATFAVMLNAIILGRKKGCTSVIVYILLGSVGMPVFSGFKGGLQVLFGPTGGYIWAYILMTLIIGTAAQRPGLKRTSLFLICIAGSISCYALGTVQFSLITATPFGASLAVCVLPFVPFDIIKAAAAVFVGTAVRSRLKKARLV